MGYLYSDTGSSTPKKKKRAKKKKKNNTAMSKPVVARPPTRDSAPTPYVWNPDKYKKHGQ